VGTVFVGMGLAEGRRAGVWALFAGGGTKRELVSQAIGTRSTKRRWSQRENNGLKLPGIEFVVVRNGGVTPPPTLLFCFVCGFFLFFLGVFFFVCCVGVVCWVFVWLVLDWVFLGVGVFVVWGYLVWFFWVVCGFDLVGSRDASSQ